MNVSKVRDWLLLIGGAALLANETLLVPEPRAILVGVAVAMLGIPTGMIFDKRFTISTKDHDQRDEDDES